MPSWPRSIIHPPTSVEAVFFVFFLPSEFGGPGSGQFCLLQLRKNPKLPHSKRFLMHLSGPFPSFDPFCYPAAASKPIRSAPRQRLHPAHHRSEQPPRQMTLRQQEPVAARA